MIQLVYDDDNCSQFDPNDLSVNVFNDSDISELIWLQYNYKEFNHSKTI